MTEAQAEAAKVVKAPEEASEGAENEQDGDGGVGDAIQNFLNREVYGVPPTSGADINRSGQEQQKPIDNTGSRSGDALKDLSQNIENGSIVDKLRPFKGEPSEAQRKEAIETASDALKKNPVYAAMSPEDQKTADRMQEAAMRGDAKALAELAQSMKDRPEMLAMITKAVGDNLTKVGADTNLVSTPEGGLLLFNKGGSNALQINKDGTSKAVAIETTKDGSVRILNDRTVVTPSAADLGKQIGNNAVNSTNFNNLFKHFEHKPIQPGIPGFPGHPDLPFHPNPRIEFPKEFPSKK